MSMIGWRGILALHFLAADMWLLTGAMVAHVPSAVRMHWAAEPLWLTASFLGISTGLNELLAAAEGWLGPPTLSPSPTLHEGRAHERIELYATAAFAAHTIVHLAAVAFAPTKQRRRLCMLGLMISGSTFVAHAWMDTVTTITSTYGRPFQPLRHVLWVHTSPGLALIVAGPSFWR